jgi:hypothetical protein
MYPISDFEVSGSESIRLRAYSCDQWILRARSGERWFVFPYAVSNCDEMSRRNAPYVRDSEGVFSIPLSSVVPSPEPPSHTFIARNHESTGRCDFAASRDRARKERAPSFSLDHMQSERECARTMGEGRGGAFGRGGKNLTSSFEYIERLCDQCGECAREGTGDE